VKGVASFLVVLSMSGACAEDSVPLAGSKFIPGMSESESRNSHVQNQPVTSKSCIASTDFDHFRDETLQQYRASPAFTKTCTLGDTKQIPDGFGFATACRGTKTIITFRFTKDLVSQTIENLIEGHRSASSSILTMMRRVGDCPGQTPPGRDS